MFVVLAFLLLLSILNYLIWHLTSKKVYIQNFKEANFMRYVLDAIAHARGHAESNESRH